MPLRLFSKSASWGTDCLAREGSLQGAGFRLPAGINQNRQRSLFGMNYYYQNRGHSKPTFQYPEATVRTLRPELQQDYSHSRGDFPRQEHPRGRELSPLDSTKRKFAREMYPSPSRREDYGYAKMVRQESVERRPMKRESSNLQSPVFQVFKGGAMQLDVGRRPDSTRDRQQLCPYFMEPMSRALNKPYSEDYFDKLYREQFFEISKMVNSLDEIKRKPREKGLNLSRAAQYEGKKTLLLDLDETLIHSYEAEVKSDYFIKVDIGGEKFPVWLNVRPYAREFLSRMSKHFEVIIYTASHGAYAETVVNEILDPKDEMISHVLSRQLCPMSSDGFYFKDLGMINRDPRDLILVDNSCYSFCFDLYNGLPVLSFYDHPDDRELPALERFLLTLVDVEDVRKVLRQVMPFQLFKGKTAQETFESFFKN